MELKTITVKLLEIMIERVVFQGLGGGWEGRVSKSVQIFSNKMNSSKDIM